MILRRSRSVGLSQADGSSERPPAGEREIISSMRDTYVRTASETASVMAETSRALSSYFSAYRNYTERVGREIRGAVQTRMLQAGLDPIATVGVLAEAMKLASKVESESHALENTKRIYEAASDTLKNVGASWQMWKDLRFSDMVSSGLIGEDSVEALSDYLGVSREWMKSAFVLSVAGMWASKKNVPWRGQVSSAGELVVSEERKLWTTLSGFGQELKIPDSKKVGSPSWNRERASLVSEYRGVFLAAARKAYESALKGRREPGTVEIVFNWIVDSAKTALGLALFSIGGLPGILLHISMFRLVQFGDLSKSAYSAARILPAAVEVLSQGVLEFSQAYKSVRIDQGKSDAQAKKIAIEAAEEKIEVVGKPVFSEALRDVDLYMNHYKRAQEAFNDFLSGLKDILLKILLYGGLALGALGVGFLLLRNVLPTPTVRIAR